MKKVFKYTCIAVLMAMTACTDYNVIDTGIADENAHSNRTMMEYFKTDPYNWDSLRVMINHAELTDIFEGKGQYAGKITVLGMTNHSIRRYMLSEGIEKITDIPAETCKQLILDTIIPEYLLLETFPTGRPSKDVDNIIGTGGKMYTMLSGKKLWIYTFHDSYNGVLEAGPLRVNIVSPDTEKKSLVGSHNIKTRTGVVHSLSYDFTPKDF